MEIKVNRKEFLQILIKTKCLTSSKTNLAITSTVLLIAKDNKLKIQATDLETHYQNFCSAKIIQPGNVAVSFKELHNFIQKNKSQKIHMVLENNYWLKIFSNATQMNIVCMDSDDFPTRPKLNCNRTVEIKVDDLKEMINKTVIISDKENQQLYKKATYFEVVKHNNKDFIRMVVTNGSQLNLIDKKCNASKLKLNKGILIPKTGLSKLNKMFLQKSIKIKNKGKINPFFEIEKMDEDRITLGIDSNYFIVKKLNAIVIIRLLESKFPDYNNLLEYDKNIITVDKNVLLDAMKQMKTIQTKQFYIMLISIENNVLKIVFENPDIGEIKKTISIEYIGPAIQAKYDFNQFAALLNIMNSKKIELNINSDKTPCIITGKQDKYFLALITPWRNYNL